MLVGGDLAPEVGGAGGGFAGEELILDKAVNGFDITLPSVALGRDITVVGAQGAHRGGQGLFVLIFQELATVVGLPGQAGEVHAIAGEMFGQKGGVALGEFIGVAGEAVPRRQARGRCIGSGAA